MTGRRGYLVASTNPNCRFLPVMIVFEPIYVRPVGINDDFKYHNKTMLARRAADDDDDEEEEEDH
jgi:hypothetical protein